MTTYIMTREEREQAIKDFTAVLPRISAGEATWSEDVKTRTHRFICVALDVVTRERSDGLYTASHSLVRRSLGSHFTYEGWLKAQDGIDFDSWSLAKIQRHRKRWLRTIIKALQDSLK